MLAIAAGAGAAGWALAGRKQESPLSASFLPRALPGSKPKQPQYASMLELELVRIASP